MSIKAVAGITRSMTPGFTRATMSGTRSQLQPVVPESDRSDQSWDGGSGVSALMQDVAEEDDYNGDSLQLLGLDGTGDPRDFSINGGEEVMQRIKEARLGIDETDRHGYGGGEEDGDDNNGHHQQTHEGFSERQQRFSAGVGYLRSGVESDLNYPFHFLNVFMRYHDAGIIRAMVLLLMMVALIGTIWVMLLEYTPLKDIFATRNIPGSLSIVNLIVALVYNTIIQQSLSSYESGPRLYLRILHAIRDMSRKFTEAVEVPRSELFLKEKKRRTVHASRCLHAYELCKAMSQFALLLFNRETDPVKVMYSEAVQRRLYRCGMRPENKLTQLPTFVGFLLDDWMEELTVAKNQGLLDPGEVTALNQTTQVLRDHLDELDAVRQVRAPDIFANFSRAVLYFYVLFILPVSMYDDVDVLMIVSYAIVFFLVFGPIFIRWWLGDPFDNRPRYTGMGFQSWRASIYAEICLYQSTMRYMWMGAFPEDYTKEQHEEARGGVEQLRCMHVQICSDAMRG